MSSRKTPPAASPASWWRAPGRAWLFALPALLALALTLPVVQGPMLWDDTLLISGDGFVHHLSSAAHAFTRSFWAGSPGEAGHYDYYRPVTTLTYILNYAVAGPWSGPYHLVNSAIYALTAGLLALLLASAGLGGGTALAASLVFVAWPTHHENVDFISGRTDLLAALFLVLAAHAALRSRRRGGGPSLVLLCAAAAGAAFSKEVAYLAPAGLVLFEWALGWRRDSWLRLAAVALPVAAAVALRHVALEGRVRAAVPQIGYVVSAALLNTRTLLLPWPLHINRFVPVAYAHPHLAWGAAWCAFLLLGLAASPGRAGKAAWVFGWMLLVPGCFTGIPSDRMLYLPTLVLVPWGAARLSALPWPAGARAALCAALVLLGGAGLVTRGMLWLSERDLFESQVREAPWDPDSHDQLADAYHRLGAVAGAPDSTRLRWFTLSLRQNAQSTGLRARRALPWYSAARTLSELGYDSLAVYAAGSGLAIAEDARARLVQATALVHLGRYAEAVDAARRGAAQAQGARDPETWATLGWALLKAGRAEESVRASDHALMLDPTRRYVAYNRALALLAAGRVEASREAYRALLEGETQGATAAAAYTDLLDYADAGGARGKDMVASFEEMAGLVPGNAAVLLAPLRAALEAAAEARAKRPAGAGAAR